MPVIPGLRRQGLKDPVSKATLGYIVRPTQSTNIVGKFYQCYLWLTLNYLNAPSAPPSWSTKLSGLGKAAFDR